MERVTFVADAEIAGKRIDVAVSEQADGVSRSLAQTLVQDGHVHINGETTRPARRLAAGDVVEVDIVRAPSLSAAPEDIPLTVVYQDSDLVVIDKPAGLVVHPAAGHESGTLANALASLFPSLQAVGTRERPGIVHRLDKDTSGLLVVALNPAAHSSLQAQIAARTAGRRYLALASGTVVPNKGTIDAPIGRDPKDRKRMAVYGVSARPATTRYEVREQLSGFTFLEATLETGRTHQIRVHFAAMGHPLAGDSTYHGEPLPGLERQFLHAHRLTLRSPSTGGELEFSSPLPDDLGAVLDQLQN